MPVPLLAIASGAVKVGQKIFGFFKKNKERKAAKKVAKAATAQANLSKYNEQAAALGLNFGGATPITEGAAVLNNYLAQKDKDYDKEEGGGGGAAPSGGGMDFKNPMVIGGIVIGLFVVLKALKIIK